MVKIKKIDPESTAAEEGIKIGDKIISINGKKIKDYIDFLYETSEPYIELMLKKENGDIVKKEIYRKAGQPFGIEFDKIVFDGLKQCTNDCIFCFVKQQPSGMRESLNQKDDDYRFSFLQGSFITLTNLNDQEINRIIEKRLGPLNISVHTTNPKLRVKMMKNPDAARIMELLKLFKENDIEFNTQIVLCPNYNNSEELDHTISDLINLYPHILSIGIVPVGLTKYRDGLTDLRTLTEKEMDYALQQIKSWQKRLINNYGMRNFIYAADEFYLNTDSKLPGYEEYHDFPQLENGIGLTRLLWDELDELEEKIPKKIGKKTNIILITSELGYKALKKVLKRLNKINNLDIEAAVVKNEFFGEDVTVTGLLTAKDIKNTINNLNKKYDKIILPEVIFNDDEIFLDNISFTEFRNDIKKYRIEKACDIKALLEVIQDE
ncbi:MULTISPECIES: DUF512 domain-containing protein [unclassified Halanaerobium]|uniref:DUF512 domain-containing protein n=1 Tax=unclassified Halanaerobium TaxID=2641197 RepID=UPI000DF46FD8|nr:MULTISPECIES: DUF512 domain-containing protein [unclassified Halanaerobium]RCW51459.1 putative radical SAM enzyme (TIGR03279 family) [Halanaerobium sp. MA284_MarDTE_T2]RCW89247.1 putative radical SAM enzyme (TIGR03279 family) [Halanaerobium sp. DL-01]